MSDVKATDVKAEVRVKFSTVSSRRRFLSGSRSLFSSARACAASPAFSAALIFSISSSADSREISIATRSRAPSASQTKSTHSAWSRCASYG